MAEVKPDELVMFTSEIGCVEFNTLRDQMTIIVPADFDVQVSYPDRTSMAAHVSLVRKGT